MDSDDSGYISTGNIRKLLGHHIPSNHIEDIILEAESELNYTTSMKNTIDSKPAKDHFISYEEFLALWDDQHDQEHRQGVLKKITEMRRKCLSSSQATLNSKNNNSNSRSRSTSTSPHSRLIHENDISEHSTSALNISSIDVVYGNNEEEATDTSCSSIVTPSDISWESPDYSLSRSQFLSEKALSVRRYADI